MQQRLQLFDAVVTPRACFAAATWTMTERLEKRLRGTQRKMLRFMVCRRRCPEKEDWVAYVRRSTHDMLRIMETHGLKDWVQVQRLRKWRFARATASRTDGRWSTRILNWKPIQHGGRSVGRPATRWGDDLERLLGEDWVHTAATDPEMLDLLENVFLERDI